MRYVLIHIPFMYVKTERKVFSRCFWFSVHFTMTTSSRFFLSIRSNGDVLIAQVFFEPPFSFHFSHCSRHCDFGVCFQMGFYGFCGFCTKKQQKRRAERRSARKERTSLTEYQSHDISFHDSYFRYSHIFEFGCTMVFFFGLCVSLSRHIHVWYVFISFSLCHVKCDYNQLKCFSRFYFYFLLLFHFFHSFSYCELWMRDKQWYVKCTRRLYKGSNSMVFNVISLFVIK